MSERRDWSKVGEIVSKTRALGLSIKEGAKRFGVRAGFGARENEATCTCEKGANFTAKNPRRARQRAREI